VTLAAAVRGKHSWSTAGAYVAAQVAGAFAGVLVAHLMFGVPAFSVSHHAHAGAAQIFSEAIATFGLLLVILALEEQRPTAIPWAVGLYIIAAFWFTASTSFANPAVTLARAATDTSGSRAADVPGSSPRSSL